ncbi:uncharacterized protein LOC111868435 isoform X2 [Cryptotermes secundus]|nr:uncharacterized protein LOC111868435 isoform X2 [Cryptotermes secundus]
MSLRRWTQGPQQWSSTFGYCYIFSATRGKVNSTARRSAIQQAHLPVCTGCSHWREDAKEVMNSSDRGMLWFQSLDPVALRCHLHGIAAVFLLILLVQQGIAQQADDKGDAPNHGVETPAGYRTSFSCVGRLAGYYADISSGCQLYHMCDLEGRRYTNACPKMTLFQQRMMICDHWYMVNCNTSEQDYGANQLIGQRDKPFVGPDEHLHHREPVHIFTILQNLGSLQRLNWFPEVINQMQQNSAPINNTVSYNGRLMDRIQEDQSSKITSTEPHSTANRIARNRDINTTESQTASSQISDSGNLTETMDSNSSARSRALPLAYTNNPFFQSLLLRTTPPTPQNMTSVLMHFDTSRSPNNDTAKLKDDQNFTMSQTSDELEDLSKLKFSSTRILSQQLSTKETNEVSVRFGNSEVEDMPASFTQHKVPAVYTNNSFLQYLTKTFTVSNSTTMPQNTEETTTPRVNISVDESKYDLNNTVQIHLLDPRRMFFIPESDKNRTESSNYDFQTGNVTLLFISVPLTADNGNQSVMHFRSDALVTEGRNPNCLRCHPSFLLPGTCHPCVIIR